MRKDSIVPRLGIFDSGIGGEAVAAALRLTFPDATITTVNDRHNVPYGNKTPSEVVRLTDTAIQPLLQEGYDIIILACNTATALAIEQLRQRYPTQKFIGIEPMIKTAAHLTRSQCIAVCATPATLDSQRYRNLIQHYGTTLDVIEPDCQQWASLIENNQLNHAQVAEVINDACRRGADVIVLGCTHYHWIKDTISELAAGRALILEPSEAIGRRVEQLLSAP
jgi:glutamate racemase